MIDNEELAGAQNGDLTSTKISQEETHEDLEEFNRTKKTVTDLLNYKRSLINMGNADAEKIKEIKARALDAINSLFDDIVSTRS